MPRKKFIQDLESARTSKNRNDIYDLQRGEDDGAFTFVITHPNLDEQVTVVAMVTDLGEYPASHEYIVYTSDDTPAHVGQALQDYLPSTTGKNVEQLFQCVRTALSRMDSHDQDSDMQSENEDEDDEMDYDLNEDFIRAPIHETERAPRAASGTLMLPRDANRVKRDLRATKEAGFRVGILGHVFTENAPGIISISCKVKKLGISLEAMKAWQLRPNEYLTLLIRFPHGYRTAEQLKGSRDMFDVRLRVGNTYKPRHEDAVSAFVHTVKDMEERAAGTVQAHSRDTFISSTINKLLVERLPRLLHYRANGMSWTGAEQYYNNNQGRSSEHFDVMDSKDSAHELHRTAYPHLVTADHLDAKSPFEPASFPLVAMQYALRHFVRCTEFCLICHSVLSHDVEALKPYVCSSPLCLYQYMRLGFGPSIDHEIVTQPMVVDLLVSFCYTSASDNQLHDFPVGLGLTVPHSVSMFTRQFLPTFTDEQYDLKVKIDLGSKEMILEDATQACPFAPGDWVVCRPVAGDGELVHFRITETTFHPSLKIGGPVTAKTVPTIDVNGQPQVSSRSAPPGTLTPREGSDMVEVIVQKYDTDFDGLTDPEKREAIKFLLHTLPDVDEMQQYLQHNPTRTLKNWHDRISPSAAAVLRWVVASNRACIVQVDDMAPADSDGKDILAYIAKHTEGEFEKEERVAGMKGWMQFRFAMGAPDKEHRFMQQVRSTAARRGSQYPTLFAWHGSHLRNWHSIIREGLHFKQTINGRAFGHGVYHSQLLSTSLGYCHNYHNQVRADGEWPSSRLQITQALSLNELVNAPDEYVSHNPHLVVSNLDWIQTRYLFVRTKTKEFLLDIDDRIDKPLKLDPQRQPMGEHGVIQLPMSASKATSVLKTPTKRKGSKTSNTSARVKRSLRGSGTRDDPMDIDEDDRSSIATEDDDRQALIDIEEVIDIDDDDTVTLGAQRNDSKVDLFAKTKFRPGKLDFSSLYQMPEPSYASVTNSRRLQADFRSLLKQQETEPAHQLGWYINPDKIENMYQWIIELHSFEHFERSNGLPILLAGDLDRARLSSIVLEMRFGPNYPFQPPFVRVVRPRFLGFQQGGGGHVTLGGALCMELLTNSGWSSVATIESVLMQVRLAIGTTEPPARLMLTTDRTGGAAHTSDYGVHEAIEAYQRACRAHGWEVPADLRTLAADAARAGNN
ncbi:Hypothetical protein D9617_4g001880 [Elsinoe fawcettii]|nr:Hypothetical protein D9617_4g001880 [Elsinoe fawcettii]